MYNYFSKPLMKYSSTYGFANTFQRGYNGADKKLFKKSFVESLRVFGDVISRQMLQINQDI